MRHEKLHAVVARSTFRSQNGQNIPASDHFWKLRCRKSRSLWYEANFKAKMYKIPHVRSTFVGSDLEKVHAVVARRTFRSRNAQNTRGSDHFWRLRCRFASLHYITLHHTTLHNTTTTTTQLHNYTTTQLLHNYTTTLHYTTLHSTTLNYTPLHYTTLPSTTLHYITLHYTPLQLQLQLHNYTPLH